MKTRELTTIDGKAVTEYVPETDEDWNEVERMQPAGEMDAYGSFADVQERAARAPRIRVSVKRTKTGVA